MFFFVSELNFFNKLFKAGLMKNDEKCPFLTSFLAGVILGVVCGVNFMYSK